MKRPELLIPAGNLEKLRTALLYGADAVYVGIEGLSLRAASAEFPMNDLEKGIREAHRRGVKVYGAMNLFARNEDLERAAAIVPDLESMGIDALIVSDPGMIRLVRQLAPKLPLHLSTQANTTNAAAVRFWAEQGISRVVLARELTLAEIAEIAAAAPETELELFVHGAMCMAYSGRCFLSAHWNRRSANQGDCTQPCRWDYYLVEASRPDQPLILGEDARYSYLLSSKDLCMIEYIPEILAAGVSSLKVEGRMKSVYYVAAVTRVYRQAIDAYLADSAHFRVEPEWLDELRKISYRDYTTGFYFTQEKINEVNPDVNYWQTYDLVGTVLAYDAEKSRILVGVRNGLWEDDTIELLLPQETVTLNPAVMVDEAGVPLKAAHNGYRVYLPVATEVPVGAVIRRKMKK
ncbi:MAG TPA: U32 family peptidase [Bacillota bacterium]|nr:U32 family peptidase [Bacillota bacterium]